MKITNTLSLCVVAALFAGCSNKPSDETTRNLVSQYLSQDSAMTGGLKIPKERIHVSNSYNKDGRKVMVVQIGGMVCDMPVIKTEKDWMATGLTCNGSVYTPEEAAQERKKEDLEGLKKFAEQTNKKVPFESNGVRIDGVAVKDDTVTITSTIPDTKASDFPTEKKAQIAGNMQQKVLEEDCNNEKRVALIQEGIKWVLNYQLADKTPLATVVTDKAKCEAYTSNRASDSQQ